MFKVVKGVILEQNPRMNSLGLGVEKNFDLDWNRVSSRDWNMGFCCSAF